VIESTIVNEGCCDGAPNTAPHTPCPVEYAADCCDSEPCEKFTLEGRDAYIKEFFSGCEDVIAAKGEDYSHGGVAFRDFETIAHMTGLSREMVGLVLMSKHIVACVRWAKEGAMTCDSPVERLGDIANYAAILAAMSEENRRVHGEDSR
jgi:hypothetical protein